MLGDWSSRKSPVDALGGQRVAPRGFRVLPTQLSWLKEGGSRGKNPGLELGDFGHITALWGYSCPFRQKE